MMKLDFSCGVDQGDLARMLGRLEPTAVDCIVQIVRLHEDADRTAEDIRQYGKIGR
jgi:hypothetical protein